MQDFPWKDTNDMNNKVPFENDLVDYLSALKVTGCFLWPIVNLLKFVFFGLCFVFLLKHTGDPYLYSNRRKKYKQPTLSCLGEQRG